jgi:syntaxin 1B/2/3
LLDSGKMNDLFTSGSFKKYADLKQQVALDDLESGGGGGGGGGEAEGPDLDRFFEDVDAVKEDLRGLEALHRRLQSAHVEGKTAHDAAAVRALRARADADADQVLRRARAVKARLEALDRANAASRKLPGCGPGSSTDRTRTSVVTGLGKKLKDLMEDFQVRSRRRALLCLLARSRFRHLPPICSTGLIVSGTRTPACRACGRAWRRSTRRRWRGGTTR